eukprot:1633461-Rhodomonas_salina.1
MLLENSRLQSVLAADSSGSKHIAAQSLHLDSGKVTQRRQGRLAGTARRCFCLVAIKCHHSHATFTNTNARSKTEPFTQRLAHHRNARGSTHTPQHKDSDFDQLA